MYSVLKCHFQEEILMGSPSPTPSFLLCPQEQPSFYCFFSDNLFILE